MTFTFSFFATCNNLNDVKQVYRKLALQNHPDKGGDPEIMKAINTEYEKITKYFAKYGPRNEAGTHTEEQTQEQTESAIFENEAYRAALDAVINIEGIIIEVVGSWIWITGNTFPHRKTIAAFRFGEGETEVKYMWANAKKAWYFRTDENKTTRSKKGTTLDDIKQKYGSERVNNYKPAHRLNSAAA